MKKLLGILVLGLLWCTSVNAKNLILECSLDAHIKDYTEDNTWLTFDHNQKFKLKIKDNKMIIYDYTIEMEWFPHFKIQRKNRNFLIGTHSGSPNEERGFAGLITYRVKDGYTVFMSTTDEFGLTVQTGYCK